MSEKKLNSECITARIGKDFNEELLNIIDERKIKGLDKTKKSIRFLTNLLVKHDLWKKIKKDIINFERGIK